MDDRDDGFFSKAGAHKLHNASIGQRNLGALLSQQAGLGNKTKSQSEGEIEDFFHWCYLRLVQISQRAALAEPVAGAAGAEAV